MRDERIGQVYLFPNGNVAVCDLYGEQMPAYQDPDARGLLEIAYPRHLWHEWVTPGQCRCGRGVGEHSEPPPLKRSAQQA